MTPSFPHIVKGPAATPGKVFYDQWQSSPFADEYLARMGAAVNEALTAGGKGAKHAAQETGQNRASSPSDRTGKRAVPNLLAMASRASTRSDTTTGPTVMRFKTSSSASIGRSVSCSLRSTVKSGPATTPSR